MHGLISMMQNKTTTRARPFYCTAFPADPRVGEHVYRTDLKAEFVFIGVGEAGTTTGWFNLKNALYSA
jgi:hypothetical protein